MDLGVRKGPMRRKPSFDSESVGNLCPSWHSWSASGTGEARSMLSSLITSLMVFSLHSPAAIQDYITFRAMSHGIHPAVPLAIIESESGFKIDAKNPGSTASGLAQFINGTFRGFCIDTYRLTDSMADKNNPYVQIECHLKMLKDKGIHHWDASKNSWAPKIRTVDKSSVYIF